jgi:hypothetical protein
MVATAQELLDRINALDPKTRHELVVELLRHDAEKDDLPDDAFAEIGAEVFRMYDEEEAERGKS